MPADQDEYPVHSTEDTSRRVLRTTLDSRQLCEISEHLCRIADTTSSLRAWKSQYHRLVGATPRERWASLEEWAGADVAAARIVEPHLDALVIQREAGLPDPDEDSMWGVYAAESPGHKLRAERTGPDSAVLTGVKPWCSLAGDLTHALVTAHTPEGRGLFAVSLGHPGVTVAETPWNARGLREIPSGSVEFGSVPARPVGDVGWYFDRPGFAWGGVGVAAAWLGGAIKLARIARAAHAARNSSSETAQAAVGRIDALIHAGHDALDAAGRAALADPADRHETPWTTALRTRNLLANASARIQDLSRELAGPAFLTGDEDFAKADADLTVYRSQHHGSRDDAALGVAVLEGGPAW